MPKPVYILGTGLSHDGSSCLLKDGRIIVGIEKERITKKKHDGFNDNLTIQYCLDAAGIGFKDLSLIVQENTTNFLLKPEETKLRSNRILPADIPTVTISHHMAHAYSAFGTSPFLESAVIVMDGQGSSLDTCMDVDNTIIPNEISILPEEQKYLFWEKESYYLFQNGKMKPIFKDYSKYIKWDRQEYPLAPFDMQHSIAEFYGGVSYYVFDEEFSEGKLMGLAPFGREEIFQFDAFEFRDRRVFFKYDWMKFFDPYMGGKYKGLGENFQYYADLAFWAQKQIEKAIFYLFNSYYDLYPHENVSYAGGLALNAVANAKLFHNTKFKNFYIQPAAGDNGLALGCCFYGWFEILKKDKIIKNSSTYFGKEYKIDEVFEILNHYPDLQITRTDEYINESARLLAEGKIIAWFQNGSEFGPRALGNRSIIADPRKKDIKNFINRKIKHREDFRPFAPSVIAEDFSIYFDGHPDSPHMLLVAQTKPQWIDKIPGIVHKDGSARVQTVSSISNNNYYKLLNGFKKLTGISVLVNTSFNDRGLPIIETPGEAIEFFLKTKNLDVLVIGDFILQRKNSDDIME